MVLKILQSVTISANVNQIGYSAFSDVSAITILEDAIRFDSIWEDIGFPKK